MTNFTPTSPLPVGRYRFWVLASNEVREKSSWSDTQEFAIIEPVGTPVLTAPSSVTNNQPQFGWTAATNADSYELWLTNLTDSTVKRFYEIRATNYQPAGTLIVGDYRLWVRALGGAGNVGEWSEPLDFSVAQHAPPIELNPEAGLEIPSDVRDAVLDVRDEVLTVKPSVISQMPPITLSRLIEQLLAEVDQTESVISPNDDKTLPVAGTKDTATQTPARSEILDSVMMAAKGDAFFAEPRLGDYLLDGQLHGRELSID